MNPNSSEHFLYSQGIVGFLGVQEKKKEVEGKGEGGRRMEEERAGTVFLTFGMVTGRASAVSDRRSAWKATCAHHGQRSFTTLLQKCTFFS